MKKIIPIFSLCILLFHCRQFKPPVPQFIISGNIENIDIESFKLIHTLDKIVINVNEDGSFSDTIYDFVDGYYSIVIGNEYAKTFIKDGFDINLSVDQKDFDESISYKGIGANENNYLAQKFLQYEDVNFQKLFKLSEDSFTFKIDSLQKDKMFFLENIFSNNISIDANFIKYEKASIEYFAPLNKERYKKYHRYYSKNDSFEVSDSFYSYRKEIPLENVDLLNVAEYTDYVETFFDNQINEDDSMELGFSLLKIIDAEIIDNSLKKKFIYRSAKKHMSDIKKINEYWAMVSFMVTEKYDYKELSKLKRKLDKITTGKNSPNTVFKDEVGKEYSLSDFKGKVVYIDCWAQWCAPCKKETPFLQSLEEKYKDQNIVFIKLSLDTDEDAWKNYINEHKLEENAFILDGAFKSEFAESYMIRSIPRFILLDKDLKIVDADAPRPSDVKLVSKIDDLLTK